MKKKLQNLLEELNHGLIERQEAVKLSLLAALASEHMLLVGPPGTGKSMIARRISECFNGSGAGTENDYFEYLLTKFSTPEEIFGPLSISELKADRFKRNTAGYLPTVKVAFLDEIFKASSSILNALLTILNERIYHNGTERQKVPLQSLIAASNELPVGQDELNALYDRFLVRCFVDYVSTDSLPRFFETDTSESSSTYLGEADLKSIQDAASAVILPALVQEVIQEIWIRHKEVFKEDRREQLSDRRLKKIIHLLRVAAATNDRSEVDLSDLLLLKNCLWNHPDNVIKVKNLVFDIVCQHNYSEPFDEEGDSAPVVTLGKESKSGENVVRGYSGCGSAHDPFLVGSVNELHGLSRPEVGLKGYYFRQIADIDCSALTSWDPIAFVGYYDGGGFCIHNGDFVNSGGVYISLPEILRAKREGRVKGFRVLFDSIGPNSVVSKIRLISFNLANEANQSRILNCESSGKLIVRKAQDSHFVACLTDDSLIGGDALGCTISRCQAGSFLVRGDKSVESYARLCTISDSLALVQYFGSENEGRGGLVDNLTENSLVERCLVTGRCNYSGNGYFYFSGLARKIQNAQIRNCALGPLERSSKDVSIRHRIAELGSGAKLHNNAAIDSVLGNIDSVPDGQNGKSVSAAAFNQYFFEHTLGWNFSEIWSWDQKNNLPTLRDIGVNAKQQLIAQPRQASSIDAMGRQLRANIWW